MKITVLNKDQNGGEEERWAEIKIDEGEVLDPMAVRNTVINELYPREDPTKWSMGLSKKGPVFVKEDD